MAVRFHRCWCVRTAFLAVAVAAFSGCGWRESGWIDEPRPDPSRIAVLEWPDTAQKNNFEERLKEIFPGALRLAVDQLAIAAPHLRRNGAVLVVYRLEGLGEEHWRALAHYLEQGGAAIFWGRPSASMPSSVRERIFGAHYSCRAEEIRGVEGGFSRTAGGSGHETTSPFPRAGNADIQWRPLAEAKNADGLTIGWPCSLFFALSPTGNLGRWAWLGWGTERGLERASRALLRQASRKLLEGRFLYWAEPPPSALKGGEPLSLKIGVLSSVQEPVRITAELLSADGTVLRRASETLVPERRPSAPPAVFGIELLLNLGTVPTAGDGPEGASLVIRLTNAEDLRRFDEFRHGLLIVRPERAGKEERPYARLATRGGFFAADRRPVLMTGVRFEQPFATPGTNPPLAPWAYDPAFTERLLNLARTMGFEFIEISLSSDPAEWRQAAHLLETLKRLRLRALIHMPDLSPWSSRYAEALASLDALSRTDYSPVWAIAADVRLPDFASAAREPMRLAWQRWLDDHVRDRSHDWTEIDPVALARTNQRDRWASAPSEDGAEKEVREAVQRFWADEISRFLRRARVECAARLPDVLFTAFGADGYAYPPDRHHVDFVTRTLRWSRAGEGSVEVAFAIRHARGMAGGKPALCRLDTLPSPGDTEDTSLADGESMPKALADLLGAMARARAAGVIWPRLTVDPETIAFSGCALLLPDLRPSAAGKVFREAMAEWRRQPFGFATWQGVESDLHYGRARSAEKGRTPRSRGTDLLQEIRPIGWNKESVYLSGHAADSTSLSRATIAGRLWDFLNAEWLDPVPDAEGRPVRAVAGRPLSLSLLNTGSAAWSASRGGGKGTVWIRARSARGREQLLPINRVDAGGRFSLTWLPPEAGEWKLRPYIEPWGEFGESLPIKVDP